MISALHKRTRGALLAAALIVTMVGLPATSITAQEKDKDPRKEQEEVRRQRAEVAAQVDALEAETAEVEAALADLAADVSAQEAALADAERSAADARANAELATQRVADTEALLAELENKLRELAVDSYIEPPANQALSGLERASAEDAATREALLAMQTGNAADVVDQMKATKARLEGERAEAEAAAGEAERQRDDVKAKTDELQAAYERQAAFAAEVEMRLDARLAEADSLAPVDAALSAEIARQEAELAAKLKAQQEAARKAGVKAPKAPSIPIPPPGEIVKVREIQIHESIAGQLEALLAAAEADGVNLSGGGWRSSESQIALRRAHCGSSHYAIYEAPASSCHPPTARPGSSNHERGLAIDFTCDGGGAIGSRSSRCYQWLAANAERYGLYNLPSEPWHWSINGQ